MPEIPRVREGLSPGQARAATLLLALLYCGVLPVGFLVLAVIAVPKENLGLGFGL